MRVDSPAGVGIIGSGFAVPERVLTNDELATFVDTNDEWIRTRTGIHQRHILSNGTNTSDLAGEAARQALTAAGVEPGEVDLIICATATPDMPFPAAACQVQHQLGCRRAAAFDVSAACSGFIYGLVTADSFIQAGRAETVLLVGADCLSKYLDWNDRSTCVLFGDGAGAVVLRRTEPGYGLLGANLGSDGSGGDYLKVCPPAGLDEGPQTLQMAGREVFKFALRIQTEACEQALAEAGVSAAEVDWLVPHQANIRIINAAAERLAIPPERVFINVERYGNTSAASIPIAVSEAVSQGLFKRGDNVLMVGFGAGLTWGSALVRWW